MCPVAVIDASELEAMRATLAALTARMAAVERTAGKNVGRMTPREAGRAYHVSHDVVRDACKRGELAAEQTDKGWLIAPADAETWWSARMKREGRNNQ